MKRIAFFIIILISIPSFAQKNWQLFGSSQIINVSQKNNCNHLILIVDSSFSEVEIKSNCFSYEILSFQKSIIIKQDSAGRNTSNTNLYTYGYCNCESCSKKSRTFHGGDSIFIKTCNCASANYYYRPIEPSLSAKQKKWKKAIWNIGDHIQLENLLFYPNKSTFLPESYEELDSLVAMLKRFPNIKIEIQGHVNGPKSRNTEEFIALSENRAKSVFDYLLEKGISSDRLVYKGYGNTKMRFPNAETQLEMESNRRVEILILSR